MTDVETIQAEMNEVISYAIQQYANHGERGAQAARYEVGISDLGYCSERTRRMLAQEDPDDTDMMKAFLGTAVGDHVEKAIKTYAFPAAIIQPSVVLRLVSDTHTYDIPGHPDVVIPSGVVIDGKTIRGLSLADSKWTDQQKRFQRHGYAAACSAAGMFDVPLGEVLVGNLWIDRAGDDPVPRLMLENYDPDVLFEMTDWLEETIYAFTHDTEARKEPAREVCAKTCGFFGTCRAFDTDVSGLLTDGGVVTALTQYERGKALVREGERLKDQAKPELAGVEGFALIDGDRFALRWVHTNESQVSFTRKASEKIDVRKVK